MHDHDRSIIAWLAAIGAAGAEEIAAACALRATTTRARLRVLERGGLVQQARLLHREPALHLLTRAGLRAAGRPELAPAAVSAATFAHQLAVARVAVVLGGEHGRIHGERELRALERAAGRPLASAEVGYAADGAPALHRPDLVCWGEAGPIAIEVELTVKAPRRLRAIVRGWARSRRVAGVVYYASPAAARAVSAALRSEQAGERVAVLGLDEAGRLPAFVRRVPSQAARSVASAGESTNARRP